MVAGAPGSRRYVPVILFAIALTLLLVGFARPEAKLTEAKDGATVVLMIDVSGLDGGERRASRRGCSPPDAAIADFVKKLPSKYRDRADHLLQPHRRAGPADVRPRHDRQGAAEDGPARGDGARRRRSSRPSRGEEGRRPEQAGRSRIRRRRSCSSPTAARTRGRTTPAAAAAGGAQGGDPGLDRRRSAPPGGMVSRRSPVGKRDGAARHAGPGRAEDAAGGRARPAAGTSTRLTRRASSDRSTRTSASARLCEEVREITVAVDASPRSSSPRRRRALRLLVPEARMRLALGSSSRRSSRRSPSARRRRRAAPTNECNGIKGCIPVAGPVGLRARARRGDVPARLPAAAAASSPASTRSRARRTCTSPSTRCSAARSRPGARRTTGRALPRHLGRPPHRALPAAPRLHPVAQAARAHISRGAPVGAPLDLAATTRQAEGRREARSPSRCPNGETLVDSWHAIAFDTVKPPPPGSPRGAVEVAVVDGQRRSCRSRRARRFRAALPAGSRSGRCAPR